jgi:hypothetical protein
MRHYSKNRYGHGNKPLHVRCYDNGGETFDRFTVVYTEPESMNGRTYFTYVGMSSEPFHPQGFGQHGDSNDRPIDRPTWKHLGKRIDFFDLPPDCQRLVLRDYRNDLDIQPPISHL